MKKIIIAIAFCFVCKASIAQTFAELKKMTPAQKAMLVSDSLKKVLKLNDAQYQKVYATALQGIKKAAPVVNSDDRRISKGLQLQTILNDSEDKLKEILTSEQFATYEKTRDKTIAYCRQQQKTGKLHL